jgi:hypothetical protein
VVFLVIWNWKLYSHDTITGEKQSFEDEKASHL